MTTSARYGFVASFALLLALFPTQTSAHTINQPPFVYTDGVATGYYPVGYSSLPDLKLPQDSIGKTVVVGDTVAFHIDTAVLPVLPEVLPTLIFHWDFGDGTEATGADTNHTYTKSGPFILTMTSQETTNSEKPQVLDTILVNVLPSKGYTLPTAVITINGQQSTNFISDILKADFANKVTLEATRSKAGTSSIKSYTWDLGDQQLAYGSTVIHSFNPIISIDEPVLRVTDSRGFYSDAIVQLANSSFSQSPITTAVPTATPKESSRAIWIYSGIGILILIGLTGTLIVHHRHVKLTGGGKKRS